MGVAQYLWLAMTCAGTTSVADLRVFQCEGEGGDPETRISVVILEGGAISFTSGSGALLASATIAGSASASGASTSQHLVRARKRLLADSTASSFASAVVARLLDERSGGAARAVVAAECDEAISTVELSSTKHTLASPPRRSPRPTSSPCSPARASSSSSPANLHPSSRSIASGSTPT
ncbi:hypothetical protein B0H16DRAFT_1526791, partial [Mycena metata]